MGTHGLGELALYREERVEARHRVLEHRADVAAEHDALGGALVGIERLAADMDRAGGDASGLFEEPHHGIADGGLAGAGLAHEGVDLARLDDQRGILDGREDSCRWREDIRPGGRRWREPAVGDALIVSPSVWD